MTGNDSAAKRLNLRSWGMLSACIGMIALVLAIADFKFDIFDPPPPPEPKKSISKTLDRFLAKVKKADEAPPPAPDWRDTWGRPLYILMAGLAAVGIIAAVIGWIKHEARRPVYAGIALSVSAIMWESIVVAIAALLAVAFLVFFLAHADL